MPGVLSDYPKTGTTSRHASRDSYTSESLAALTSKLIRLENLQYVVNLLCCRYPRLIYTSSSSVGCEDTARARARRWGTVIRVYILYSGVLQNPLRLSRILMAARGNRVLNTVERGFRLISRQ